MITLNSMAEQILRILSGGDIPDDFEFQPEDIIMSITQYQGAFLYEALADKSRKNPGAIPPELLTVYRDVAVSYDSGLALYYSSLPSGYMGLPFDKGVFHVSGMQGQMVPWMRIASGSYGLYHGLEAGCVAGKKSYWVEGDRLYYQNVTPDDTKVLIKMVAKPSDIDPDDELPISTDHMARIVEAVVSLYAKAMAGPHDSANDSNQQK